jgi:hypothetical protein
MLAKVDGNHVEPGVLWWPEINFDQFRWDRAIGMYELEFPRTDFVQRLAGIYAQCVHELREDDRLVPDQSPSPLRDAGYPPLDAVLDNAEARKELIAVFLYEEVFEAFLSHRPARPLGS